MAAGTVGLFTHGAYAETKPGLSPLDSEKFRIAAVEGNLPTVMAMLDRDPALLYARDAHGVSVYTLACLHAQPKIADELTRRRLVLDIFEAAVSGDEKRAAELAKDDPSLSHHRLPDDRTPLHLATQAGKPGMVVFCAMHGADLSAGPESPLLAAVDHPDHALATEMAVFLLMNASDPNARRKDGKSALQLATARGYDDLVAMLIHRGADPSEISNAPSVERVYFDRRFSTDLQGKPVTREDTYGIPQDWINRFVTLAHFDFEQVKKMQKLCPTLIMTRATWDELAIEASAHMGLTPMARFLADLGAPVSVCTATMLGESAHVKRVIAEDPACLRERGAHDIALLAYTGLGIERAEIAELLLRAGSDVHARSLGQTTLHIAARKGYLDLARLLLDRGADVNALAKVQGASVTPLAAAVQAKQDKMADMLKDHGGRV